MQIKKLSPNAKLPTYATPGSAAMDLYALLEHPVTVYEYEAVYIPTGLSIHINNVYIAGHIHIRSGLSTKKGIVLANQVGIIDSDYQGEIIIALRNDSITPYTIRNGDRIAQLEFVSIERVAWDEVGEFTVSTDRGNKGFGSTGV